MIYSDPGSMTSGIKNPTKESESVSMYSERNMIGHLDLDEIPCHQLLISQLPMSYLCLL